MKCAVAWSAAALLLLCLAGAADAGRIVVADEEEMGLIPSLLPGQATPGPLDRFLSEPRELGETVEGAAGSQEGEGGKPKETIAQVLVEGLEMSDKARGG